MYYNRVMCTTIGFGGACVFLIDYDLIEIHNYIEQSIFFEIECF